MTMVRSGYRVEVARRGATVTRLHAVWQGWAGHLNTDAEVAMFGHLGELVETRMPAGRA